MRTKALLFIVITLLNLSNAFAQYGGTTGDLTWSFNLSEGLLVISGEGDMPDYSDYPTHFAPWYIANDYITTVVIESGVTSIGNRAFFSCTYLTSITISHSVTKIGNNAFQYCFRLPLITIPNKVTLIGNEAFANCTALISITIPNSVTSIGDLAFNSCRDLTYIDVESDNNYYRSEKGVLFDKHTSTLIRCPQSKIGEYVIPDQVKTISNYAFSHCINLTSIFIPNGVQHIESFAFYFCENLTSIIIPNSVTNIEESGFDACTQLKTVTLSKSITSIKKRTFCRCSNLTLIKIPNNVTNIETEAFLACINLTSIILPKSLKRIGDYAFLDCFKLQSIVNLNHTPISISKLVFCDTFSPCLHFHNVLLFVPTSAIAAYTSASVWNLCFVVGGGVSINPIANNREQGYTTGDGLYKMDTMVTVCAYAYPDNKFISWSMDDVMISTENPYSFTATEDVELVANFKSEVGVSETQDMASLQVYPNPTTGELQITNDDMQITNADMQIFDIMGRNVHSFTCPPANSFTINISHLKQGVYFIKIQTVNRIITKKIIKI